MRLRYAVLSDNGGDGLPPFSPVESHVVVRVSPVPFVVDQFRLLAVVVVAVVLLTGEGNQR